MADQSDLLRLADRARAAARAYAELAPAVADGEPWPLSDDIGTSPESHWGPPEVLAHVAEMLPFWTGELERVLAGSNQPVPFGRVATNDLRIGIIDRDRSLPSRELLSRIDAGVDRLAQRLGELGPSDLSRRGAHPTLGELTAVEIVERFVASHLDDHLDQLRRDLGA